MRKSDTDVFAEDLQKVLHLDDETTWKLAELLEQRMKDLAYEQVSEHTNNYEHKTNRSDW